MASHPPKGGLAFERRQSLRALSELDAFILLDDTLDSLNKQYLDAKVQRKELVALYGDDDAMASVAIDMEDSAWCAMQTRYIELRAERKIMAQAQAMMRRRERDMQEQETRILHRDKEKQARDLVNYLRILKVVKEKNRTPKVLELFAVLFFLDVDIFGNNVHKTSYDFQAMA